MHLVFTRDGIVGLFIPKPSPQAVGAYFLCYFFLLAEMKSVTAVTLKMIFVKK